MEMTIYEIMDFYGCCRNTAYDRIKEIKSYFKIKRKGGILRIHLAKYEGLTLQELSFILATP